MLLAALHGIEKYYGEQTVLQDANLELRARDRIALIGRNGSGKTTLLRILTGEDAPDGGTTYLRDGATVAVLQQDPRFDGSERILDIAERSFRELDLLEERLQTLEQAGLDDPGTYERWEALHETFERRGGYERRARRDSVLHALGFRGRENEPAVRLSGGEKTRLGLAQLLMTQPDVLLLDEPTNHLDIDMIGWLEGYLGRYPGGVIIVSHDRAFLDSACGATAEIRNGVLRTFDGGPTQYREYREEQLRIEEATRANQRKEHDRLEAAATQMKKWAGQNAKLHRRAKSMERRLERYEGTMIGDAEREGRTVRFRFPCDDSGDIVLQAERLAKSFAGRTLFDGVEFTLRKGDRVALVGPNGAGKTSFLRMILGELPSDDPRATLRFGSRVRVGYYDQELRGVDPDLTLIDEMIRLVGDVEAHNLLGAFLFPYEAQYKRIRDLSGGERARLALLKLTLGAYNLLVLDEPTNHLDVEMIEALEAALDDYDGTMLIVSHDRRFIRETSDTIWEVRDGHFIAYEGDWEYYARKRDEYRATLEPSRDEDEAQSGAKTTSTAAVPTAKGPSKWKLERTLEELEGTIQRLEGSLAQVTERLANPNALAADEIAELGRRHAELEEELLGAMTAWDEATELLASKG